MAATSGAMMLGAGTAAPSPNTRMDQPSAYALEETECLSAWP